MARDPNRDASLARLHPELLARLERARGDLNLTYPSLWLRVESGYRSQAYQDKLRARWDSGDRSGLVVRPAARSSHSSGRAVDLQLVVDGRRLTSRQVSLAAWEWIADQLSLYGLEWEGPDDPVHFELPRSVK